MYYAKKEKEMSSSFPFYLTIDTLRSVARKNTMKKQ